jgi:hypothetical protein
VPYLCHLQTTIRLEGSSSSWLEPSKEERGVAKRKRSKPARITFTVVTLQKGSAPEPRAEGDKLVVGGQSVSYDGEKLIFEK